MNPIEIRKLPTWTVVVGILAVEFVVLGGLALVTRGWPMGGFAVREGAASVQAKPQVGVLNELSVARVVSPGPAWVLVQADMGDGTAGPTVGYAHVGRGVSNHVRVPVDGMGGLPQVAFVTLVADGGRQNVFEYDMNNMPASRDRPFIAGGASVSTTIPVATFGVNNTDFTAFVDRARLEPSGDAVRVGTVMAPEPSWVVVSAARGSGKPDTILGKLRVPAGDTADLLVALDSAAPGQKLRVTLLADKGKPDVFEFDPADLRTSADKPYVTGGMTVSTWVGAQ